MSKLIPIKNFKILPYCKQFLDSLSNGNYVIEDIPFEYPEMDEKDYFMRAMGVNSIRQSRPLNGTRKKERLRINSGEKEFRFIIKWDRPNLNQQEFSYGEKAEFYNLPTDEILIAENLRMSPKYEDDLVIVEYEKPFGLILGNPKSNLDEMRLLINRNITSINSNRTGTIFFEENGTRSIRQLYNNTKYLDKFIFDIAKQKNYEFGGVFDGLINDAQQLYEKDRNFLMGQYVAEILFDPSKFRVGLEDSRKKVSREIVTKLLDYDQGEDTRTKGIKLGLESAINNCPYKNLDNNPEPLFFYEEANKVRIVRGDFEFFNKLT